MKHTTSRALFSYWNGIRGQRLAPQRFEIDPSRISALLPYTFVLERLDAETFRYRLAGTSLCEVFGCELRGTNFLEGWATIDRVPLLRQLSLLTRQGAVALVHMEVSALGERPVACEVILLPLTHTRDSVDRVLGAFSLLDAAAWIGAKPVTSKSITGNEVIWPAPEPHLRAEHGLAVAADAGRLRPPPYAQSSRRPQFRVLEGGLKRTDADET
jgi:hypothetical protein